MSAVRNPYENSCGPFKGRKSSDSGYRGHGSNSLGNFGHPPRSSKFLRDVLPGNDDSHHSNVTRNCTRRSDSNDYHHGASDNGAQRYDNNQSQRYDTNQYLHNDHSPYHSDDYGEPYHGDFNDHRRGNLNGPFSRNAMYTGSHNYRNRRSDPTSEHSRRVDDFNTQESIAQPPKVIEIEVPTDSEDESDSSIAGDPIQDLRTIDSVERFGSIAKQIAPLCFCGLPANKVITTNGYAGGAFYECNKMGEERDRKLLSIYGKFSVKGDPKCQIDYCDIHKPPNPLDRRTQEESEDIQDSEKKPVDSLLTICHFHLHIDAWQLCKAQVNGVSSILREQEITACPWNNYTFVVLFAVQNSECACPAVPDVKQCRCKSDLRFTFEDHASMREWVWECRNYGRAGMKPKCDTHERARRSRSEVPLEWSPHSAMRQVESVLPRSDSSEGSITPTRTITPSTSTPRTSTTVVFPSSSPCRTQQVTQDSPSTKTSLVNSIKPNVGASDDKESALWHLSEKISAMRRDLHESIVPKVPEALPLDGSCSITESDYERFMNYMPKVDAGNKSGKPDMEDVTDRALHMFSILVECILHETKEPSQQKSKKLISHCLREKLLTYLADNLEAAGMSMYNEHKNGKSNGLRKFVVRRDYTNKGPFTENASRLFNCTSTILSYDQFTPFLPGRKQTCLKDGSLNPVKELVIAGRAKQLAQNKALIQNASSNRNVSTQNTKTTEKAPLNKNIPSNSKALSTQNMSPKEEMMPSTAVLAMWEKFESNLDTEISKVRAELAALRQENLRLQQRVEAGLEPVKEEMDSLKKESKSIKRRSEELYVQTEVCTSQKLRKLRHDTLLQRDKRLPAGQTELCRICDEHEISVAFLDCWHTATCRECADRSDRCPICRQPKTGTQRIFYG